MTFYKIQIDRAGNMHHYPSPGGLGWRAYQTFLEGEFEDYSSLLLIENNKLFVSKEVIHAVGRKSICKGESIKMPEGRRLHELTEESFADWAMKNSKEPRGQREAEVKQRNEEILNFLKELM